MAKKKLPPEVQEFFRKEGARGGKIGGKRSLETMTDEQRSARAKNAVNARIAKAAATKKSAPKKKA